jgi:hypothetical protein
MKPRGKRKDLAPAIVLIVLWVTALGLESLVFSEWLSQLSMPQRLAIDAVVLVPLLYGAAQYFAWYWKGRGQQR